MKTAYLGAAAVAMFLATLAPLAHASGSEPEPVTSRGEVVLIRGGKPPLCLTADANIRRVTVVKCVAGTPCTSGTCIGLAGHIPADQQWVVSRGEDSDWTYIIPVAAPNMSLSIGPVVNKTIRAGLLNAPTPLKIEDLNTGDHKLQIQLGASGACLSLWYTGTDYAVWVKCNKEGYWQGWQLPAPPPVKG